ncbi:MAG: RNA polymerase sigma factor FliA [Candidatus Endonucleobacter bathymodioli]|uniref:RNA polymerase sigma factor FliA n=1 Tax=Candidatus Endonucleibacter bathymodioli TaxID=539814 RepID=A0AA90NST8_9GAMM|nr:RNA polymerase sigma factor FliA [Candidatus Endonucleobacter bathymodioli]
MSLLAQAVQENRKIRDEWVEAHRPLVKRIANHLGARMPASVQIDDLVQSGMIGLLEAAKKYDATKGASFETFAGIRIRGAMLDEIRKGDWGPRSVYRNSRRINEAVQIVEAKLGRDARDAEVAAELNIKIDDYYTTLSDLRGCRLFSFEELFDSEESRMQARSGDSGPQAAVYQIKFKAALVGAIDKLPEREKIVLTLYYNEEMNLKEIGKVLGVSESRVSQIHSQAAVRLRSKLQSWVS